MTLKCEKAAMELSKEGISVELIDLRTITPLDTGTIIDSVRKTGRLLVVDEGTPVTGSREKSSPGSCLTCSTP